MNIADDNIIFLDALKQKWYQMASSKLLMRNNNQERRKREDIYLKKRFKGNKKAQIYIFDTTKVLLNHVEEQI